MKRVSRASAATTRRSLYEKGLNVVGSGISTVYFTLVSPELSVFTDVFKLHFDSATKARGRQRDTDGNCSDSAVQPACSRWL